MESPDLLENGNTPQNKKLSRCQVVFYTLICVLIVISALVSAVFCLLHHKQALEPCWAHGSLKGSSVPHSKDAMSWEWNLKHCDGFVQDHDQYLKIEQNSNYFIYAQISRLKDTEAPFTVILYKEPDMINKIVGSKKANESGTINFWRPFFLQKGDKLYWKRNNPLDSILTGNQSYWGLYKI